ncbi:MAG: ATP-binding protein [Clostridia bacterium]|nr:ATP-binding protein [Clostridia bacterium]
MRELSLNILDIAENSVKAGATLIQISITVKCGIIEIRIEDNGCGMNGEFLKTVIDPFTTTRTTRKVGMGIPLFKMAAEQAGGSFNITSTEGIGTKISATFQKDHIDRAPIGAIEDTVIALIAADCKIDYTFCYSFEEKDFALDTREIKAQLDNIPIDESEVLQFIKGLIIENILSINGGVVI